MSSENDKPATFEGACSHEGQRLESTASEAHDTQLGTSWADGDAAAEAAASAWQRATQNTSEPEEAAVADPNETPQWGAEAAEESDGIELTCEAAAAGAQRAAESPEVVVLEEEEEQSLTQPEPDGQEEEAEEEAEQMGSSSGRPLPIVQKYKSDAERRWEALLREEAADQEAAPQEVAQTEQAATDASDGPEPSQDLEGREGRKDTSEMPIWRSCDFLNVTIRFV